jgi:diketogulonate reductase-like aldo/keto reductase
LNGVKIPKLALGTWFINNEAAVQAVKDAAKIGYRHIYIAQAYGNESCVGEGIRACGVNRGDMFVTTKLSSSNCRKIRRHCIAISYSLLRGTWYTPTT